MKECVECGKMLGIIKCYRHPTMGKDYLLCSSCFDTISESVEKWSVVVSQYVDFFNKKSSLSYNISHDEYNHKDQFHFKRIFNNVIFNKNLQNVIRK